MHLPAFLVSLLQVLKLPNLVLVLCVEPLLIVLYLGIELPLLLAIPLLLLLLLPEQPVQFQKLVLDLLESVLVLIDLALKERGVIELRLFLG